MTVNSPYGHLWVSRLLITAIGVHHINFIGDCNVFKVRLPTGTEDNAFTIGGP